MFRFCHTLEHMRVFLAFAVLAACHKPSRNCERAVEHVFALVADGPPGSKPHAEEQAAIDQIQKAANDHCDSEGLSDAQRDCILAAKSLTDRAFLTCPALVARPPSWIIAPIGRPEAIDDLEKLRRDETKKQP